MKPGQSDKQKFNLTFVQSPASIVGKKRPLISPLRYPGSKRRLYRYVEATLRANGFVPDLYVEPFAGGASVALQLLQDRAVHRIGLADSDPLVASFWRTVFFDSEWLISQVENIKVSLENWRRFKQCRAESVRSQALTCLFLNRTSFSGIIAPSSGPIGGPSQTSDYTIECRFPRETLIRRIRQAAELRDRVAFIWNADWKATIERVGKYQRAKRLPRQAFYYLDPPFFEKADRLYRHYFNTKGHEALRDFLLKLPDPWLLSYDAPRKARSLYGDSLASKKIGTLYSAAADSGFREVDEILLSNLPSIVEKYRESSRVKPKPTKASRVLPLTGKLKVNTAQSSIGKG